MAAEPVPQWDKVELVGIYHGTEYQNLKPSDLGGEAAKLAHETKTEAIRRALLERRARLLANTGKPLG